MPNLRTSFRFPRPILKHAATWRDRASWTRFTRLSLSGRRGAPVLRKLSIGLTPLGLAVALIALPALATDAGWLSLPNAVPGPGFAGPRSAGPPSGVLQIEGCPSDPALVVGAGVTCSLAPGTHTYQTLTIQDGGAVIALGDPGLGLGVTIVAQDITIDAGGQLSAQGQGYPGGQGPGAGISGGLNQGAGGGGHGGIGGTSEGGKLGGIGYGDVFQPISLGSGGGNNTGAGGAGGGAIHLVVADTLTVNGAISANGGDGAAVNGYNPGGGAGGSIWIQAVNLSGGGFIMANGGDGGDIGFGEGGSGAGGRIALDTTNSTFAGEVLAHGCNGDLRGGPGTLYYTDQDRLIVDNFGCDSGSAVLEVGDYAFNTIQLSRFGHLRVLGVDSTFTLANATVNGDGTAVLTAYGTVIAPDPFSIADFTLDVQGALDGPWDLTLEDQGELILHAHTPLHVGPHTFGGVMVHAGGTLTLVPYDTGDTDYINDLPLELQAFSLTIEPDGLLNSDGLGYPGGSGPGAGAGGVLNQGGGGGGHGGFGGSGETGRPGGSGYGDVYTPTTFGSGGGNNTGAGGAGGGAIHLVVEDTLIVDGTISANGGDGAATNGRNPGGGAGGSIWIQTGSLAGEGFIRANGGRGGELGFGHGGGGAGGRIAIEYTAKSFGGRIVAYGGGGHRYGGPGTIYDAPEDKVVISNDGHDGAAAGLVEGSYHFDSITLSGYGHLDVHGTGSTLVLTDTTLSGDGTATLTTFGTVSAPPSFTVAGFTLDVQGTLTGVTDVAVGDLGGLILHARTPLHADGPYVFDTVGVTGGGRLVLAPYDSGDDIYTDDTPFELTAASLTVEVGGEISSDGLGYVSQRGPGAGQYSYDAGASGAGHGGVGGAGRGQSLGGVSYGSALNPAELGSGGGNRYSETTCGGAGGGAVHFVVAGTVLIDGRLSADGLAAKSGDRGCGGGSGGSLWIQAGAFVGAGSVTANGGDGSGASRRAGGGGGGRIALFANSVDFAGSVHAHGGLGFVPGSDGTAYLGKVDPILSTVAINPPVVPTDGVSEAAVTVTLRNALGFPVAEAPVEIALASGGQAYLNGQLVTINEYVAIGTTAADGVASGTIRADTLGVRTVEARSGQETIAQLGSVEFIAGSVDASESLVDAGTQSGIADGVSPVSIIVTARDQFGNPIEGLPVEIFATGNAAVTQPTELTNSLGHTSGSITDAVAEVVTVTARISGVLVDDEATVTFVGADLAVDKTALAPSNYSGLSSTHALAGGTITYALEISNDGLLDATEVEVTDTLPAGLTFTAEDNGYPFQADGQTLTWQVGSIPVSEAVSLQFEAGIANDVLGIVTNTVTTTTSTTEGDLADNSTDLDTTVELPRPSMAVSPGGPTMTVLKGDASDLAANVRNTGAALMTGVTVSPPPTISWVSVDPGDLGDISPLDQAVFTIHASPPAGLTSGYYRDFVTVTDDFGNTGQIALTVRVTEPRRDVGVTVENDQGHHIQGATLTVVRQDQSVVVTQGAVQTYHESAQEVTPASGVVTFAGLEIGAYDHTVTAADHGTATGVLTIVGGGGAQEVTLTLNGLGRIGLSPSAPVLGVVRGETNSKTISLTNLGAGPLTGLSIQPPPSIPWVTLGLPDPLPVLQPGESLQFSILASPAAGQSGDIFQDYVTATADGGLSGQLALTVQLTSDAVRDAEVNVVDTQDQAVTGGGSVTLVQQELTTLLINGETETFNQQFTGQLDPSGRASFPGLEPGAYNFIASANGFTRETGEIVIQPGTGVQLETVAARIDPFRYSWTVTPIEQGYDITLTMTFDVTSPDPALAVPEVCWPLDGGPTAQSIQVFNPTGLPLTIEALSASLPGASIQIGSFPSVIDAGQLMSIPVTATNTGSPGSGSVEVAYAWDAAPDEFVTFAFNPSSLTSPLIYPGVTYTKDYVIVPAVFDPDTTYTLEIGQPSELTWISLGADRPGPMQWTSDTLITVSVTATPPTFLAEGVYTDAAPITVSGDDGTMRQGSLNFTATRTAEGLYLHTNFELGDVPTVHREATATGTISSGACSPWTWSSVGGRLAGHISGSSVSFPGQGGGPVYDFGHHQVRLELSQEVMLEGEGFEADLDMVNTSAAPIEGVSIDIRLTDEAGLDMSFGFATIPDTPSGLGTIGVGGSASGEWFILPTGLGVTSPQGEVFLASAAITYTWGGTTFTVYTVPERITVYPAPDLVITYQLPLPDLPCTVFPLKVTIQNRGAGPARNLRFSTAQPRLLDPSTGLPITFRITSTTVNGAAMENALNLSLGDVPAGESAVIVWTLESSIPGRFVEFTSDYRQSNYLGVPLSPLISEIHTDLVPGPCAGVPDWAVVSGARECPGISYQGTQIAVGEPINTRTGGLSYEASDLSFPTSAGPLTFERWYASPTTDAYTDTLGYGWTHSLDSRLYFPEDPQGQEGAILLKLHSANRYEFIIRSDGTYLPYPGVCGALTRHDGPPTTYTFVDTAQQIYTFAEAGRLQTLADPQGHMLHYLYDGDGRLSQVHDDNGARFVSFSYDAQGRIEHIADHSGRQVSYSYDPTTGDLAAASDVLGGAWTYEYDDEHRLTRVTDPTGSIVERTEYDGQGRAVRQYDGEDQFIVELTYSADGSTVVTDALGNQQAHQYDERGELTDQTDALGGVIGKTYDGNFRPSSLTDPAGNTTQLDWSDTGANLTQVTDASGGTTQLSYDDLNNLTEIVDPAGNTSSLSYDALPGTGGTLLTGLSDALGNVTTYTYTDAGDAPAPPGLLETITDPLGHTTTFTYDAFGQRAEMTDALGHTSTYAYDDLGRLVEITDPLGRVSRRAYDAAGRLVRVVRNYDPLRAQNEDAQWNITTEFVCDAAGNVTEVINTFGRSTRYEYDGANRVIAVTDPAGHRTEMTYDQAGNLVESRDPFDRITRYEHDAANRVVKVIDPLGGETLTQYDANGNVASITDANGNITHFEYDELSRPAAVIDALGGRSTTEYDAVGNVVGRTDAAGHTTTYAYDALSRMVRQTDPAGGVAQVFYDAAGNRVRTVDPIGGQTRYVYDALNRLVRVIDALGGVSVYAYDAVGNQVAVTDANGSTTRFSHDLLNRPSETQDPLNNVSRTEYDALGNMLASLDALGNETSYEYDLLNRLIEQTDPLGGQTAYAYDAVGNRLSITDANGHATEMVYDALNRRVQTTDPSGQVSQAAYDAVGNILTLTDGLDETTVFSYDALYRQISVTDPLGNVTRYAYDEDGNRVGMTDAEGVVTRYEYDGLNRLTAVVENCRPGFASNTETNVRTEYSYDANGNRLTILDGNEHTTAFEYDILSRMVEERDPLGNTTVTSYDPVGNRVSLTDAGGFETSFAYDELNRLIAIDYPETDPDVQFMYDAVGDRTQMVDGVGTTVWTYDALQRPTAVTDPFGGTVGYGHDAVGNRTQLAYPDGRTVGYAYDASDRMIQVTDWDSRVTAYNYDPADRLIETILPNGVVSRYDYDAAGRLLEIQHQTAADLLSSFNYQYDGVGNPIQAVEVMSWPGQPQPVADYGRPIPVAALPAPPRSSSIPVDPLTAGLAPFGLLVLTPLMRRRQPGHPHLLIVLVVIAGASLALAACAFPTPTPPVPTIIPTATSTSTATPITPTATFTPTYTPTPTDTPTPTPEPIVVTTTTIDYTYDPLYRLTAADYSSGEFFRYAYDAVGNRLTQDTHLASNTYTYDAANRLTSVDGVIYTWDANGNLLSDGLRTYSYDHANRLAAVSDQLSAFSFAYNGLGDRLRQTINGVASNYTLDIEAGLTQVLTDGTEAFLYGVGRIAQQGAGGRDYFLGDALNSARQLVDASGSTGLGRAYEPFGDLLSIAGELKTSYGFAGEWGDATGLVHLRARYYQSTTGRFVQPDPFAGVPTRPLSLNAYPYAYDNPLTYTDASGRNPLLALAAGIAGGFAFGAAAGGVFGALSFDWALGGECGCDIQQRAISMTRWDWIGANALSGGILGGVAVAISALVGAIGPGALIAVGGVGLVVSVTDFVQTVEIILYETGGLTTCTGIRLLLDVAGIVLSTVGIVQGVRAWVASGRLLNGAPVQVPLSGGASVEELYGGGQIPDDAFVAFHPSRSDVSISASGLDPTHSGDGYLYFARWRDIGSMTIAEGELMYGIEPGKWTSGDPLTLWVVQDPFFNPGPYLGQGIPPGGPPQWRYGNVVPRPQLIPYHAGG